MIINYEKHDGYFYAKNPHIDAQRRLTFVSRNCTHYLIISGSVDDEIDILKTGIIDCMADTNLLHNNGETLNIGKYKVRCVKQSTYIAVGNYVPMDTKSSCHAVYGCIYTDTDDTLNIYIPEKTDESVVYIPLTVKYQVKRQMTEARNGFLGLGRKEAEFTGIYILRIDDIADYQNGCIYYTMNNLNYYLSKDMLGKNVYVKSDKSKAEPVLRSKNRSINLVKI